MRLSPDTRRARGFTFLELLLVLLLLGIAAALAFPRLAGVYGGMKAERERAALQRLVEHGQRRARLEGRALSLDWEAREHRFLLRPFDPLRDRPRWDQAPEADPLVPQLGASDFLLWLENDAALLRMGADQDVPAPSAPFPEDEAPAVLASLRLTPETEVETGDLPLCFLASGANGGGSIFLRETDGTRAELRISSLGGKPRWRESGP